MAAELKRISMVVTGRVQGVGYPYYTRETAQQYGITGWVRNCFNGDVELEAQGQDELLRQFIKELKKGPPMGYVTDIHSRNIDIIDLESSFTVRYS